ncbi:MAG: glycosyltransferase [Bacteroidetes bacterium]|nr:MAG: glycosyltransferase [Bacteroidota bacterium]
MKQGIIIVGKIPPPYFGPAIASKIILESKLREEFHLFHVDTRLNQGIDTMGRFSFKKLFRLPQIYTHFLKCLLHKDTKIVLIPIAQKGSALYKDAVFIILAKLFRKKIILHLRGSQLLNWYQGTHGWNRWFFKRQFQKASAAIVLGEKLRYIFEHFLPPEKVHVIPNGGNYQLPERRESNEQIRILYLANLMPSKGVDFFLEALTGIPEALRDQLSCLVVGAWESDSFRAHCEKLVSDFQLPVTFEPVKSGDEKLKCLAQSDLFVFTPRAPEGHPWVIVEAMAASLPLISTDQGAISESVLDGINGFIVDHRNPQQLREKLMLFVQDRSLLKSMGKDSHRLYLANFTEESMVQKLSDLFNTLLT